MKRASYILIVKGKSLVTHLFACDEHRDALPGCEPLKPGVNDKARCTLCRRAAGLR